MSCWQMKEFRRSVQCPDIDMVTSGNAYTIEFPQCLVWSLGFLGVFKFCEGFDFTVTTAPYMYMVTKTFNTTSNVTEYGGLCFDVLNSFSRMYNLSYTVIEPEFYDWGHPRSDGSWTGKLSQI